MNHHHIEYVPTRDLIAEYRNWISDYVNHGHTPYLLTFKFRHIATGLDARHAIMQREIAKLYARLLTRIVRRPNGDGEQQLPVWLCMPDLPVPKKHKLSLALMRINDGLHYHAIALIPPFSRLKRPFDLELAHGHDHYVPKDGQLWSAQAKRINEPEVAYVTEYAAKSILRRRFDIDAICLLPRTSAESQKAH